MEMDAKIMEEKIRLLEERMEEYKETIKDLRKDKDLLNKEKWDLEAENKELKLELRNEKWPSSTETMIRKSIVEELAEIAKSKLIANIDELVLAIKEKEEEEDSSSVVVGIECANEKKKEDSILEKMLDLVDEYKEEINDSTRFPNGEYFKSKGISRHYINKYKISGLKQMYKERNNNN